MFISQLRALIDQKQLLQMRLLVSLDDAGHSASGEAHAKTG